MPIPRAGNVDAIQRDEPRLGDVTFPTAAGELDGHYVTFSAVRYRWRQRHGESFRKKDSLGSVTLPLPDNLGTRYGMRYNNEPLGAIGATAANVGTNLQNLVKKSGDGFSGFMSLGEKVRTELGDIGGSEVTDALMSIGYQTLESNLAPIAGVLTGGVLGGLGALAAQEIFQGAVGGLGIARNPHEAVLFQTVEFRSHEFSYRLVPRNKRDTDAIRDIVYVMKKSMHPQFERGNHFFLYPHMFEITFAPSLRHYLFDIGPSFLTSFSVNYHGEGMAQYVERAPGLKAPVSVVISMTFAEATIITRDDIKRDGRGR